MTLAAWVHDLSPFVVRFSEAWGIRWYGLAYVAGFFVAWAVLAWMSRTGRAAIPPQRVPDAMLYLMLGAVIGGRLGYIAFYKPELLWTFTSDAPWWGLLQINTGGMASHGGMIGAITACFFIARGWKAGDGTRVGRCSVLHVLDLAAMLVPAGMFFGRLANFVNGELLGRIVAMPGQPAPWWAVRFPQELKEEPMSLGGPAPDLSEPQMAALERILAEFRRPTDRSITPAIDRLIDRVQHGGGEWPQKIEPFLAARHPSQLYQAAAEGIVLGVVLWLIARKPRLPGVVGCWFLITYGVLRIITEHWRLPDSHLVTKTILGLSRGQWLSALMVAVGVVALPILIRRGGTPYRGEPASSGGAGFQPALGRSS